MKLLHEIGLALALSAGSTPSIAQDLGKAEVKAPAAPAPSAEEAKAKVSYAVGQQIASNLKQQGLEVDLDILIKGMKEGLAGSKPQYTQAEIQEAFRVFQQELIAKRTAVNKAAGEKAKKDGDAYLAANKAKPGVKTTASGLQYRVLKEGAGAPPKLTDTVKANYKGTFTDGAEFDSSEKNGGAQSFGVRQVIRGWTEALQMMKPGAKWELVIPSDLAYGPEGSRSIPPNSVLVFEVELLKIETDAGSR